MLALYSGGVTLTECVKLWFDTTGVKKNVVAKRAGMAPSKISEIVSGKNPDPQWSTVEKLALGFGVSVSEFTAGPPRQKEPGRVDRPEGDPLFAALAHGLAELDADAPAEDSWRGDVLKAMAALGRALGRKRDTGESADPSATARR